MQSHIGLTLTRQQNSIVLLTNKGKIAELAYINPLTSHRSSFLLKPDNEFPAMISALNIFHSLTTPLLKKNFATSNLSYLISTNRPNHGDWTDNF